MKTMFAIGLASLRKRKMKRPRGINVMYIGHL